MSCSPDGKWLSVLDLFLSTCVFAPLVVAAWRGIWQLLDILLFVQDPALSAWCSFAFGLGVSVLLWLVQAPLGTWLAPERHAWPVFLVASRVYTVLLGLANVNQWRGVWQLLSVYTGTETLSAALSVATGAAGLGVLRGVKNVITPPFVLVTDEAVDYFRLTTRYRTQSRPLGYLFLLDVILSVLVIISLVVFIWRGSWVLLDLHFFPEKPSWSAWGSCILGLTISLVGFAVQGPASWLSRQLAPFPRLLFEDAFLFFVNCGSISIWRGVWNVLDIYLYPDNKFMSNGISLAVGLTGLLLSYSSNSIPGKGVDEDGLFSDGSGCIFQVAYLQTFLKYKKEKDNKKGVCRPKEEKEDEKANCMDIKTGKDVKTNAAVLAPLCCDKSDALLDGKIGPLRFIDSNLESVV